MDWVLKGVEPSERKGQPVRQPPGDQHRALGQPYSSQGFLFNAGARGKIYWHQKDGTDWESESEEDGKEEIGRGGPKGQEVAEKEEDEDGDESQGQEGESI